ncbi:hypothetical protein PtA15_1A38 [Puccinia triticina]|uniref:Uncharacterized protein n=1 Tax=Puccinia triticina TaxID=208348 RepID=A0ABY7C7D2_9BASI|nr:uncharacterized protein PtA15_1A38 [Puccinia triticina]WAQ80700.1 hypothetical protein PtA15_1A38 [Puccinia triticina]WAR51591.1 hypothetical protein PtB15_1B27 [Puccinia triticina]
MLSEFRYVHTALDPESSMELSNILHQPKLLYIILSQLSGFCRVKHLIRAHPSLRPDTCLPEITASPSSLATYYSSVQPIWQPPMAMDPAHRTAAQSQSASQSSSEAYCGVSRNETTQPGNLKITAKSVLFVVFPSICAILCSVNAQTHHPLICMKKRKETCIFEFHSSSTQLAPGCAPRRPPRAHRHPVLPGLPICATPPQESRSERNGGRTTLARLYTNRRRVMYILLRRGRQCEPCDEDIDQPDVR